MKIKNLIIKFIHQKKNIKREYQIGSIMKNRKILSYIIIGLSLIFILVYLYDGIREICIPYKGLGFPYKSPTFYVLKLVYACMFLGGGIDLLKKKSRLWHLMIFSSIGMLISSGLLYFKGGLFRSTDLDLFFLEIPSFFIIILFNISYFAKKFEISIPSKRGILLGVYIIINFLVNYAILWFINNYCWTC